MIGRLRGLLAWKQPPYLMIDVQGVGYELEASLNTFQNLPELGAEVVLFAHLAVREDAHTLYGFANTAERSLFRNLIRVSGIGPRLALLILSGMSVDVFSRCVREGDTTALVRLPGVGKKTAERVVVDLSDKVGMPIVYRRQDGGVQTELNTSDEALEALIALGYTLNDATEALEHVDSKLSTSERVREALKG